MASKPKASGFRRLVSQVSGGISSKLNNGVRELSFRNRSATDSGAEQANRSYLFYEDQEEEEMSPQHLQHTNSCSPSQSSSFTSSGFSHLEEEIRSKITRLNRSVSSAPNWKLPSMSVPSVSSLRRQRGRSTLSLPLLSPSSMHLSILLDLRRAMRTRYDEKTHEHLLRRLWMSTHPSLSDNNSSEVFYSIAIDLYERKSLNWRTLGFQGSDPSMDLRGGGQLALQCLIYFCEVHRARALEMIAAQKFSWAIAGVNLCTGLTSLFGIDMHDGVDDYEIHAKLSKKKARFWPLLDCGPAGFFELFCHGFCLLEACWDEGGYHSEMDFPRVLEHTIKRLGRELQKADGQLVVFTCNLASSVVPQEWTEFERNLGSPSVCPPPIVSQQPWTQFELQDVAAIQNSRRVEESNNRLNFLTQRSRRNVLALSGPIEEEGSCCDSPFSPRKGTQRGMSGRFSAQNPAANRYVHAEYPEPNDYDASILLKRLSSRDSSATEPSSSSEPEDEVEGANLVGFPLTPYLIS